MALYALHVAYAPVGWAALLNDPQNRLEAVRPVVQRLGGSIVQGWFTFGQYDVLLICEMPDTIRAAALSISISVGGAVKAAEPTALMSFEDGLAALTKAKAAEYTPPPGELPYVGLSGVTP